MEVIGATLTAVQEAQDPWRIVNLPLRGILVDTDEGFEMNLLGRSLGANPVSPASKPPAIRRLGLRRL